MCVEFYALVVPAKAGIQSSRKWIPAFAGMTECEIKNEAQCFCIEPRLFNDCYVFMRGKVKRFPIQKQPR